MVGKTTDPKGKGKENKSVTDELTDHLATFTLPDSLPCSEVQFPTLINKRTKANWKQILQEREQKLNEIQEYVESKKEPIPKSPFLSKAIIFICKTFQSVDMCLPLRILV